MQAHFAQNGGLLFKIRYDFAKGLGSQRKFKIGSQRKFQRKFWVKKSHYLATGNNLLQKWFLGNCLSNNAAKIDVEILTWSKSWNFELEKAVPSFDQVSEWVSFVTNFWNKTILKPKSSQARPKCPNPIKICSQRKFRRNLHFKGGSSFFGSSIFVSSNVVLFSKCINRLSVFVTFSLVMWKKEVLKSS